MNENIQQTLLKQFIKISDQKWIKGINNTTNSVGLTFEINVNAIPLALDYGWFTHL